MQRNQNTVSSHFCFKTCQFTVNRRDLKLTLMQLRKKTVYFQYHLNCQYIHDISSDIDIGQVQRNQNTVSSNLCFKTCQFNVNRRDLELSLMQLRKKTVYFQYHFNCQYIHDNSGDIEIGQVQRNQNTVSSHFCFKS